ncbi:MAG: TetR/AcrR family transcriptional regulator [Leptospiraceae bacterium]|nr:TetR/AcrR family transcriptional regulator [Leptospiraceae bacterium]
MPSLKKYHHGNLEQRAVLYTVDYLKKGQITELSLRKIAADIGVSHTALYRHFASKDALFQKVAERGFLLLADRQLKAGLKGRDPYEGFILAGVQYVLFFRRYPGFYRVMFSQREKPASRELLEAQQKSFSVVVRMAGRYLKFKQKNDSPLRIATSAWSLAHGYTGISIETEMTKIISTRYKENITENFKRLLLTVFV